METQEIKTTALSGWLVLCVLLVTVAAMILSIVVTQHPATLVLCIFCLPFLIVVCVGFFTLQPNMAAVLVLFGKYKGTVTRSGFGWANPFLSKIKISLRARNLNGERIKVNDNAEYHRGP